MQIGDEAMDSHTEELITQLELAQRWGQSESAIRLSTALGLGPRYVKIDGAIMYPLERVRRHEQTHLISRYRGSLE